MASWQEDFLTGDDLDAVLALIDEDILEINSDFSSQVNVDIDKIPQAANVEFPCPLCSKICVSKRGLTRHQNAKHRVEGIATVNNEKKEKPQQDSVERLHPLYLKKYIEKSALKLANDECYPESIMAEFRSFKVGSLEDVYDLVKNVINSFDGNAENFYPKFYKVISGATRPFGNNLGRNSSLLLGFELANHVLSHLSGAKLQRRCNKL